MSTTHEKAEKISITLPPEMLGTIKQKVTQGEYGSTSEVIREAMRDWQHKQEKRELQLEALRERLEYSANSGADVPLEDAFAQLYRHHQQRVGDGDDATI